MKRENGITIVELLVSMLVIGILLSLATYIFVNFISTSFSQERQTSAQSNVQSVMQQIKWDILMTGYSVSADQIAIEAGNGTGPNNSDVLTLKSLWFGVDEGGHWTYVLDPVSNNTTVNVRKWNDPDLDIQAGDEIIFMTSTKRKLDNQTFEVVSRDTFTHVSGVSGFKLTLNNPISTSMNFLFNVNSTGTDELQEVVYRLQDNVLLRDSIPLMDDVTDFQVAYWVDQNDNQIQESTEWHDDLSVVEANPNLRDNIRLIRLNLLVSSRGESNYHKEETFTLEDNTITPNPNMKHKPWMQFANPRNLK
ncbi:MAG: PilW family protein [Candidatus Zixiibacteriota bacterium]